MTETNSPPSTLKWTPRSAGTSTFPARYSFHKFSVTTIGSILGSLVEKSTSAGWGIVVAIPVSDQCCSVVGQGFDGVLAACQPCRIAGTEQSSHYGDQRGPKNPFRRNQNRQGRERRKKH